jgi:arsenate reductase
MERIFSLAKKKVLFVCFHNSARSQMAEGLLQALRGDWYEAFSAGVEPSNVNPHAVQVMAELGIDISMHRSKSMQEFKGMSFDYVVTVCDQAKESCPFFPGGGKRIHKNFQDPSKFTGTEDEILTGFREIRDQIKDWIESTFNDDA